MWFILLCVVGGLATGIMWLFFTEEGLELLFKIYKFAFSILLAFGLVFVGLIGTAFYVTFNKHSEEAKAAAVQAADPVRLKAEEDRRKQERQTKLASIRSNSETSSYLRTWGVTAEEYLEGESNASMAGTTCRQAASETARYQSERVSWLQDNTDSWSMRNADTILVTGSNLRMQNGFGAWKKVTYRCTYSIKARSSALIFVD